MRMKSDSCVWDAFLSSREQFTQVVRYAQWWMKWLRPVACGRDAEDLFTEALVLVLAGNRKWINNVDLCSPLTWALRRVAWRWIRQKIYWGVTSRSDWRREHCRILTSARLARASGPRSHYPFGLICQVLREEVDAVAPLDHNEKQRI